MLIFVALGLVWAVSTVVVIGLCWAANTGDRIEVVDAELAPAQMGPAPAAPAPSKTPVGV